MEYEIVPYAARFDSEIAELQKHLWSSDTALNAAYFRWKYRDNPFSDAPLVYLALSGGRLVGMRGMFGALWQVDEDGARHALPHADDLVVAPEHRNRRIVSVIMQAAFEDLARRGFPFVVSLGAGPITFVGSLAAGWRSAGSFQPVRLGGPVAPRPGRARAAARGVSLLRRAVALLRGLRPRGGFRSLDREGSRGSGRVRLGREPRPEAMAELVARLPWDGRIRHVRSAAYFAWRFRNPLNDYRFLYAGGDRLEGYLVLQRSRSDRTDATRVRIADWEAIEPRLGEELLAAALGWGRFSHVQAWTATTPASTRDLLRGREFRPAAREDLRQRSEGLLVRRVGESSPGETWELGSRALLDIENWDLRMLYSMAA